MSERTAWWWENTPHVRIVVRIISRNRLPFSNIFPDDRKRKQTVFPIVNMASSPSSFSRLLLALIFILTWLSICHCAIYAWMLDWLMMVYLWLVQALLQVRAFSFTVPCHEHLLLLGFWWPSAPQWQIFCRACWCWVPLLQWETLLEEASYFEQHPLSPWET